MEVPLATQTSPAAIALASFAKDNKILKSRAGLLDNTDDVSFFRFKRLTRAFLSEEYQTKQAQPNSNLPEITDGPGVQQAFIELIKNQMIIPVEKLHYADIKEVRGWKPNKTKPTLKRVGRAAMEDDVYYAWVWAKPNPYILLYSILAIAGVFTIILFPLWPNFMKRGVWYLSMGMLGLIALFFATAIVRLFIYVGSLGVSKKPFWLFPNLFADVGVIESFQPLYGWEEPKKKKKKSKTSTLESSEKVEAINIPSSEKATGASTTQSAPAKRRGVTIEEVEDE